MPLPCHDHYVDARLTVYKSNTQDPWLDPADKALPRPTLSNRSEFIKAQGSWNAIPDSLKAINTNAFRTAREISRFNLHITTERLKADNWAKDAVSQKSVKKHAKWDKRRVLAMDGERKLYEESEVEEMMRRQWVQAQRAGKGNVRVIETSAVRMEFGGRLVRRTQEQIHVCHA
jgi:hypothetical protein